MENVVNIPGGGLATEPPEDPADRYEGAVDRLKLICPKCGQSWGREHFGEIDCGGVPATLFVACPCGVKATIPLD